MPNPFLKTKQPARTVRCSACRDFGYLLPVLEFPHRYTGSLGDVYEWDGKGGVPAGVLYREAMPCVCESGDEFRKEAEEWNTPMTVTKPSEIRRQKSPEHVEISSAVVVEEPIDLAPLMAPKKRKRIAPPPPALPPGVQPITDEDCELARRSR